MIRKVHPNREPMDGASSEFSKRIVVKSEVFSRSFSIG
jgi:hypothetical protein